MKKFFYISSLFLITLSCSDFLDVEPDEQVSFDEQFSSLEGVQQILSGVYFQIEAQTSSFIHVYPGIMGGNITFAPRIINKVLEVPSNINLTYSFQNTPESSEFETFYDTGYDIINSVNLALERVDGLDFLSSLQKDQLLAELLTARALAHYQLSLVFAQNINFTGDGSHPGIVYNNSTLQTGIDFPSRETAAKVYELLQQDLETAIDLFTGNSFASNGSEIFYFNEISARAIYARIALQNNDWTTAASQANTVIESSGLNLTSQDAYVNQWLTDEDLDEFILSFAAPLTSDLNVSSSIAAYYLFTNNTTYNRYTASGDLLELIEAQDIRASLYEQKSLPTSTPTGLENRPYVFTKKYQANNQTTYIRLSEMYLIQAEALTRATPGTDLALQRLNAIRNRAGLENVDSNANLLEEIFLERRRELAFESHLLYDIIRYKKDIVRDEGCLSSICNLNYPSPFFILPIPQESIDNNENIQQNEGY
ncbi:RagB/SusD family nutrient uptake outer membrane protein [Nonlabens marinus]|uniref:Outer membrane protein, probably involved in nutrient binding n=1 Tax=Nonlabens marinus S1-08 TaxID=1454201 RepID=W8VRU3_9FLAO|nr:RagB/SusD family nutrient uptake outer membrane protein [Nonlabens marinus]BAO55820.1 hypothetical protein NMS_1811 [Nonlabens marinus S1-08]